MPRSISRLRLHTAVSLYHPQFNIRMKISKTGGPQSKVARGKSLHILDNFLAVFHILKVWFIAHPMPARMLHIGEPVLRLSFKLADQSRPVHQMQFAAPFCFCFRRVKASTSQAFGFLGTVFIHHGHPQTRAALPHLGHMDCLVGSIMIFPHDTFDMQYIH